MAEMEDILLQEESFWRQKAQLNWTVHGERNTKYFHASVVAKRRRGRIMQLKNHAGRWSTDEMELKHLALDYYKGLYSQDNHNPCNTQCWNFPNLNRSSRWWLNRAVTESEIKHAMFELGPHKTPGPDGLPTCFYQKQWDWVGSSVCKFVLEVFASGVIPEGMNDSLICLIPKQAQPEFISQFRPICLSNVIIKVVTKIVANRFKPLMGDLVGVWQSSFVPARQTTDNILAAQELVHSLRRRKGKQGHMIIKIDLEKAYDRIKWNFLETVLSHIGVGPSLLKVITTCIQSTNMSVLWNGERLESFKPQRGLRQGDPLSPYLFVLCMETLGYRINTEVAKSSWKPCQVTRTAPTVSHLFFADDLLLFGEASLGQARIMANVLSQFCGESGQQVNLTKSKVWFSPNTPPSLIQNIVNQFGIPATPELGMYLGMPLLHSRLKSGHLQHI